MLYDELFFMRTLLGRSEKANTLAVSHANQLSASRFDEYSNCLAEEWYWNVWQWWFNRRVGDVVKGQNCVQLSCWCGLARGVSETSYCDDRWSKSNTHSWRTSAHSSGKRQYSKTDRVCFGGSYTATFFATIASKMLDRWDGRTFPGLQKEIKAICITSETKIAQTIYSLIPQDLSPITTHGFRIFNSQYKKLLMSSVGQDQPYPLLCGDGLSWGVWLLAKICGLGTTRDRSGCESSRKEWGCWVYGRQQKAYDEQETGKENGMSGMQTWKTYLLLWSG